MKRIVLIVSIFFICSLSWAGQGMGPGPGIKGYADACAESGDLLSEEWESGIGTWGSYGTGTVDAAYTTTVLRGTKSLFIDVTSNYKQLYKTFTSTSDVWGFTLYRPSSATVGNNAILDIRNGASTTVCAVYMLGNAKARVTSGSSSGDSSGVVFAANTIHAVWLHYVAGSGSDAVCTAYVYQYSAGDKTIPAATASVTNGTATLSPDRIFIGTGGTGYSMIYDQIYVNTTTMDTVCQ